MTPYQGQDRCEFIRIRRVLGFAPFPGLAGRRLVLMTTLSDPKAATSDRAALITDSAMKNADRRGFM